MLATNLKCRKCTGSLCLLGVFSGVGLVNIFHLFLSLRIPHPSPGKDSSLLSRKIRVLIRKRNL